MRSNPKSNKKSQNTISGADLTFREYQRRARETDFFSEVFGESQFIAVRLAEAASNLRDIDLYYEKGDSTHGEEVKRFLGHVLWYLSILADSLTMSFGDIAAANIANNNNRFEKKRTVKPYDSKAPRTQQLIPDTEKFFFVGNTRKVGDAAVNTVRCFRKEKDDYKPLGNEVNDNASDGDGYRFHDVLHMAYMTHLYWSPVMRDLLDRKRKHSTSEDEFQDGARAANVEEALTSFVFAHAKQANFYKDSKRVDYKLLYAIDLLTKNFQVRDRTILHWNAALLNGFEVFRQLLEKGSGVITCDPKARLLSFAPLTHTVRKAIEKQYAPTMSH